MVTRSRSASSILPSTAVLELTSKCNHNCFFCCLPWEAPDTGYPVLDEMSVEEWRKAIDICVENGVTVFSISGGEPTLKQGYQEIIEYAREQLGPKDERLGRNRIHLTTNGSTFCHENIGLCVENQVTLSLSLPGLDTYFKHTGRDGAEQILESITKASAAGIDCTAAITITKLNMHEDYETAGQALIAGATSLYINRFLPGGRGLAYPQHYVTARELFDALHEIDTALFESGRSGALGTELPMCCFPNEKFEKLQISYGCSAAKDFFAIDPSGYIRVCTHSPKRLAHISNFDSLSSDSYWAAFALGDYHPSDCLSCEEKSKCAGGCREAAHVVNNDIRGVDPLIKCTPLVQPVKSGIFRMCGDE